jgi:hypothetical protein
MSPAPLLLVPADRYSQASNEIFSISAVANGREKKFQLHTKNDKAYLGVESLVREKAIVFSWTVVSYERSCVWTTEGCLTA